MKKILFGGTCVIILLTFLYSEAQNIIRREKYGTSVTLEDIMKIPINSAVLGEYVLQGCNPDDNFCELKVFQQQILTQLRAGPTVNIYIASDGGKVDVMNYLISNMRILQERGVKFICYVERAYSAAFTILQACDERIGLAGSKYMTHYVHRDGETLKDLYLEILHHCAFEAKRMNKDAREWCLYSRKPNVDVINSAWPALEKNIIDKVL
jgi:hypothetical protein